MKSSKKDILFEDTDAVRLLFGSGQKNLRNIEKLLDVKLSSKEHTAIISGDEVSVQITKRLLEELYYLIKKGFPIYKNDIEYAVRILSENSKATLRDIFLDTVYITANKMYITPKSIAQKEYIDTIRKYDIVFGIGPAGTGKTYLAMAMAVSWLMKKKIKRIILARPAVEAGEKLGFLPGKLEEKINPYLRPLYDALHDMMDFESASKMVNKGIIEVAPLAFMRGRTLNDSFVVLDEAQNTTSEQMKMFLTRLGYNSKAVITGDVTQVDLPAGKRSGLIEVERILKDIDGIKFKYFTEKDVVRHKLVRDIIKAYEKREQVNKIEEEINNE
jgi:phosphate starvation-inducible PhoH-like protein